MKKSWDRFSRSAVNFRRKAKVILKLVRIARKGFFDQSLAADGDYKRRKDREERNLEGLRLVALLRPCRQPSLHLTSSPRLSPYRLVFLFFVVQLLLSSSSSRHFSRSPYRGAGHLRAVGGPYSNMGPFAIISYCLWVSKDSCLNLLPFIYVQRVYSQITNNTVTHLFSQ